MAAYEGIKIMLNRLETKNYSYSTFFSDNVWKVMIIKIKIKLPTLQ